jgi:hypothetical protein
MIVALGLVELVQSQELAEAEDRVQGGPELVAGPGERLAVREHALLSS